MKTKGIHHAGLVVRDLDQAIYFYHDLLGLPLLTEPTPWFDGPALDRAVGVSGAQLRVATLRVGEDSAIELIEYAEARRAPGGPGPNDRLGAGHFSFFVDDIAAAKSALESAGVAFYSDVNVVDSGALAGLRWVYFSDPDGNALELVEVAYYHADERAAAIRAYLASRPPRMEAPDRT